MNIIEKPLAELRPYARNAKRHDARQIANVATSLRRFGWRQPLVIEPDGTLVVGHCRYMAARELGMATAPCVIADDLTPEELREYRIVDNKTNEAPWDYDLLDQDAAGLTFEGFDLDLVPAVEFEPFDGPGDGGGSQLANGTKVRVVIGALILDIDDPAHELYARTKEADADTVRAQLADLIERGELL